MSKFNSIIYKGALATGLLLSLQACKVDILPSARYTEEAVWNNPTNMELYINGMYSEFKTFQFGAFPIGYDNATDALSDIEKYTSSVSGNGTVNILATDASRVNAAGPQLNYWQSGYVRIKRINELMDGMSKYAKIDEAAKKQYEAEARFIRGYVYFWLVKLHGSVILLDNLSQYAQKDRQRSSEEDCWKFIAADFAFAAENLPKQWDAARTGKATKGAAYAMLARTWLYAASIAENDKKQFNQDELTGVAASNAQTYYQNAANAAKAVVDLANEGLYALESDFASIFTNKNTKEAIFKIDFLAPQLTHNFDLGFAPPGDAPGQCLVYGVPTAELVNEFEMNDGSKFSWSNTTQAANPYTNREPRFYASILYNGASWKNRTINTTPSNTTEGIAEYGTVTEPRKTVTGYYIRKSLNPAVNDFVVNKSVQSWIELRYAEVLLIQAEAKAKLNDISGAQDALNALRNKRGLPNTAASTTAQLMTAIEHERIVELAFEGHRYWDLRRWRKAHTVLNNVKFTGHRVTASGGGFKYESVPCDNTNRQFTPALYYIPIPTAELINNKALTQIKGW
ncbi:RagB/SusD family nutrient uptake outer membrane protein [Paraflavitalea sp. CAU 1676]|uniref:RagB/SusD family nutrient uptake outer membrane protein n=1 Tax=Paraflavitalea sp. CAU 1676 TaxID=3032598 RepID=UPI0023D9FAEB|nr:RagB/SusD family nutrient uptake outer membrane protein [Paraflavitalea sp. CAU 1676]MDF2189631.1 RagB/SusD family nutrient uptake outer membrane protein [Paraflavitalea sp. CAU 1676]